MRKRGKSNIKRTMNIAATSGLVVLLLLNCVGVSNAQTHCTQTNQWWNGQTCIPCTTAACSIGTFRAMCTSSSVQDAHCAPCTMPPINSDHITGGLPYTTDNCLWVCREGYYKVNHHCEACTATECAFPLVREECNRGFVRDAGCVCPQDQFMVLQADGGTLVPLGQAPSYTCQQCAHTDCADPLRETFIKCPGTTVQDVSACISTIVVPAAAAASSPATLEVPAVVPGAQTPVTAPVVPVEDAASAAAGSM